MPVSLVVLASCAIAARATSADHIVGTPQAQDVVEPLTERGHPLGERAAAQPSLDLVIVPPDIVAQRGAACLDGSPPGYFIRRGVSTHFIVHAQGGGWCWDTATRADAGHSCHYRAGTGLGSSKFWSATGTRDNWYCCDGILSEDPAANPLFHNWTMVFIGYCDGSSMTGNRSGPFNGLMYRGRANLDSVLDDLIAKEGLGQAEQVVWTGGSAGGLATYLNADHVSSRLTGVNVVALADGGFFLDHLTMGGVPYARQIFSEGFTTLWQSVGTANDACVAANPSAVWKCAFAQYTLPHVKTPTFVIEGLYDPWQLEYTLQLDGGAPNGPIPPAVCLANGWTASWSPSPRCTAEQNASFWGFGEDMRSNITAALQPKDSAFVPACVEHCLSMVGPPNAPGPWVTWTLNNVSLQNHFYAWLQGGSAAAPPIIDQRIFPHNGNCPG